MHSEKNLEIFLKILDLFVIKSYCRTRRLGVVRGSGFLEKIHKICWFSGCDFHLAVKNLQQFMHSETILEIAANKNNWEQVLRSHFLGP